jgi:hypothetical protein
MRGEALGILAAAALLMLCAEPGSAQEVTLTGKTLYVQVQSERLELPDGGSVERATHTGFAVADDEAEPIENETCTGTQRWNADGTTWVGAGYCYQVDNDGDVVWLWWKSENGKGSYHLIGGTGKYAGISGDGKSETILEWPDGKFVVAWEGTEARP